MNTPTNDPVEQRLAEIRAYLDSLSFFERNEARDHLARVKDFEMPLSQRGEELVDAVLQLDYEEQLAIVELLQIIHARPPGVLSAEHPWFEEIINERIRQAESGETKGIPWEEVKAQMDAKYGPLDPPTIVSDSQE